MPIPHHRDAKELAMHVACLTFAQEAAAAHQVPPEELANMSVQLYRAPDQRAYVFTLILRPYRVDLEVADAELSTANYLDLLRRVMQDLFAAIVHAIQRADENAEDLVVTRT